MNKNSLLVIAAILLLIIGVWYIFFMEPPGNLENDTQQELSEPYSLENQTSSNTVKTSQNNTTQSITMHTIALDTNYGKIVFETYDEDAPKTVNNFITLANKGFYNNVVFHRIIKGFMIQGGDPTGTGTGGPGYAFADELNPATPSYKAGYKRGVVAMANAGPNTNGSQFFIMHQDYPLPNSYSIFGKVVEGQEVVDKIATTPRDRSDRPLTPVTITSVTVSDK
ncbi:MAG: peptidylprolyl isomerase [Patescibacteria group bacterium]